MAESSLLPLDIEGALWVAAIDRVPIEERGEWVKTILARVAEINVTRAQSLDEDALGRLRARQESVRTNPEFWRDA